MVIKNNQFSASQFAKGAIASGMTFNPSIDCRNDLVNFYGYTRQQVSAMSDDELFSIMDRIEDQEKGYVEEEDTLPEVYKDKKCSCGGSLKVLYVDCETRGDCEIYVCECVKCSKTTNLNYAQEWFEYDEGEEVGDMIRDIDNACFNKNFEKANKLAKDTHERIMNSDLDKQHFMGALAEKLNYLTKRYNIKFNLA